MTSSNLGFSLAEKLAIVQSLDSVIYADGTVHKGEIDIMSDLMNRLDFDSNFIVQARNLPKSQGLIVIKAMTPEKKKSLAAVLDEVANSDGHFHEKEMKLIVEIFTATDIYKEIL